MQNSRTHPASWVLIGTLFLIGSLGVSPQLVYLYEIWTNDPLRSIGALILAASLFLILRVWHQQGWELRGTWWGLLPIVLAFTPLVTSERITFFWTTHGTRINFIPSVLPVYLYVSGVVLLFAGVRVWRQAWFPLLLLLCTQPVPELLVRSFDLPLQGIAARVARSFALALGLSPTNSELLRLMFTPSFGMFIAPGCDGMRGAVTLGYGGLILGYVKRMSLIRWAITVFVAVGVGHLFNLFRLCALVLYYKVAMGNPFLENSARLADYIIGAILFMLAVMGFVWITFRSESPRQQPVELKYLAPVEQQSSIYWKAGALALMVVVIFGPGIQAAGRSTNSLLLETHRGDDGASNAQFPVHIGTYRRTRVWREEQAGTPALQMAAFDSEASDEITLGIWLRLLDHSLRASRMVHGEKPKLIRSTTYVTAGGQVVPFSTALYDDGITATVTGDTHCSPTGCYASVYGADGVHFAVATTEDVPGLGKGHRAIPIFFKIETLHTDTPDQVTYERLSRESNEFLSHVDFTQLSHEFQ